MNLWFIRHDFIFFISYFVLKFDTKVFRKVNTGGDKQHLQNDLHSILVNANAYIQDMGTWM